MRTAGVVLAALLAAAPAFAQKSGGAQPSAVRKPSPTPARAPVPETTPVPKATPVPEEEPPPPPADVPGPEVTPVPVPPPFRAGGARAAAAPTPGPLERSVSASRQFVIYQADGTIRSKVARKVEDLKTEWLKTLQIRDEWKSPIVIQLSSFTPPGAPRMRTALYIGDGGESKVQIDVFDMAALRGGDFDLEVYRALCLDLMYRNDPPKAGKSYHQPPVWLLEAFREDARTKAGDGIAAGLYERIIESGPPPKLEGFLKERPEMMDATTRAIYRARAMALLRAFLALPDGPKGILTWIQSLPGINAADAGKLVANFPSLATQPSNLSKQWALSLADASAAKRTESLAMSESLRRLALILDIGAPADPKKPNDNLVSGPMAFPVIARTKNGKFILGHKSEELLRLQLAAHPLIRPIIEEYHLIVAELVGKPKKNVEKRLTKNMELQKAVTDRYNGIADYMNWFEAAKLETPSQEFDVILEMPSNGPNGRTDPITRYLNDLEVRGW